MIEEIQEVQKIVDERPPRLESCSRKTIEAFTVSLCDNEAAFRDLQDEWNHLLDHAARKNAFLRHEFMLAWWEIHGRRLRGAAPFILIARDRERRLVGLLPFYRGKSGAPLIGVRELRFLGSVHEAPEYLDVIVADNAQTPQIVKALLNGLENLRAKYDLLRLTDMAEDALLLVFLPNWATACGGEFRQMPWMICPHIKISGDFESYLQSVSSNHRANFRRRQRKLNETCKVTMEIATTPAQVEKDFDTLFALHQKRWAQREGTSAFNNETSRLFHRRVAKTMAENGVTRIFSLKCDDKTVAALYCFLYDHRLMYYQAGFDIDYESQSVGLVLMGMLLQHCYEQGYSEFDFLRGEEEYKFRWTKTTRATVAGEIAMNARMKIYLNGLQALRHLKKRVRVLLNQINSAKAKK
jgi:CelD/BcsL family acetyltransferase involved in cellulose biosynthesis